MTLNASLFYYYYINIYEVIFQEVSLLTPFIVPFLCGVIAQPERTKIMSKNQRKNTRLTYEDRCTIETLLNEKKNIRYIAGILNKSPSTISREIKKHAKTIKSRLNDCVFKRDCIRKHACGSISCNYMCKQCNKCKQSCPDYTQSYCENLSETYSLCNGCKKYNVCSFEKRRYEAKTADTEYRNTLTGMREGFDLTYEELVQINDMVTPLIKKGQSPYHIKQSLGNKLFISESTLRRLIAAGELDVRNIDLRSAVKRKKRKSHRKLHNEILSKKKVGHQYADYLNYIAKNDVMPVQMDCVEGRKDDHSVLLTLHFPPCHMQLAFLMNEHTSACVVDILNNIESLLGYELYSSIFSCILTDNGHEFLNIEGMETSTLTNKKRTNIFFCEPNRSDEKGSCENNHRLIRYIIPKGTSLDNYSQDDITLMMNHINSYARKSMFGKCPYDIARQIFPDEFFKSLDLKQFLPQEVHLMPDLLKKK